MFVVCLHRHSSSCPEDNIKELKEQSLEYINPEF